MVNNKDVLVIFYCPIDIQFENIFEYNYFHSVIHLYCISKNMQKYKILEEKSWMHWVPFHVQFYQSNSKYYSTLLRKGISWDSVIISDMLNINGSKKKLILLSFIFHLEHAIHSKSCKLYLREERKIFNFT